MNLKKAIACFKELGFKPKLDKFEDRLIAQKIVYLLQLKGVKTEFNYDLYVRGPYSPDLTKELYDHRQEFENLKTDVVLSKKESKAIQEMKELFELKPGLLEVAATYAFLVKEGLSAYEATKKVKKLKSFFTGSEVAVGTNLAKVYLFPPSEKDIAEMKKEFSRWEQAAIEDFNRRNYE
jgi:uncharacterized protein YwgA